MSKSPSKDKDRKRRAEGPKEKIPELSKQDSSSGAPAPKVSRASMHEEILRLEDRQARCRNAEMDSETFQRSCQSIADSVTKIYDIKKAKGGNAQSVEKDMTELRATASLEVMTLKKLNRLDKLRTKHCRENTAAIKHKVDAMHLKLQNLLYEAMHLQKEIVKCQQYKSLDEDMDLVSVEEFYATAPESITNPSVTRSDAHLQRVSRLEYEHRQRQAMALDLKKLESGKDVVESSISEKKTVLQSLKPRLGDILEKTLPVQALFSLPLTERRQQLQMSQHLPQTLFVLFRQADGFGQACDDHMSVRILGDVEEARVFRAELDRAGEDANDDAAAGDEAREDDEEEDKHSKSRKKRAQASSSKGGNSTNDATLLKSLRCFPLQVEVTVRTKAKNNKSENSEDISGDAVIVTFAYLEAVRVVTVKVKLESNGKEIPAGEKEALSSHLLCHLLDTDDDGSECPTATSKHLLKKALAEGNAGDDEAAVWAAAGAPYHWAQRLAGIDVKVEREMEATKDSAEHIPLFSVKEIISETAVSGIVKAIRGRLESRLALQKQISNLEKAKHSPLDLPIPDSLKFLFPPRGAAGRIRNWSSVDWQQYTSLAVTQHLVQAKAVDSSDLFFRMQANRDPATLIALVAVKADHPRRPPIFCLNLHWNGEHNATNSEHIRHLESLVNADFCDLSDAPLRHEILSLQLQRLLTSLDAMLEAWNEVSHQQSGAALEFAREKVFLQPIRGRTRQLPIYYNPALQAYTHR